MTASPLVARWVLSPHALAKILERKISASELAEVIRHPDICIAQGPKWIFAKRLPGRTDNRVAAVILERKDQSLWVVLTVMVNFVEK